MMRWMLGIFAVLLTLWCGWWFAGRHIILTQAEEIIARQEAAGGSLALPGLRLAGFPSRFDLSTDSISWQDPSGRVAYEGGAAHSYAMSWKPWHLIFWLPDSQRITIDGQVLQIDGSKLHASLRATPSTDVALALAALSAEDLNLSGQGLTLKIGKTDLRISAGGADANDMVAAGTVLGHPYHLGAALSAITPDPALIAALQAVDVPQMPATQLPAQIDRLHLDAVLGLSAPIDRYIGQTKPQPSSVTLRDLTLIWGDLNIAASGSLSPDAQEFAAGTITVSLTGWEQLPRLLVALDTIDPQMAGLISNMLRGLASKSADGQRITMDLVFKNGRAVFGPLPLGNAPRLTSPAN
ncbi:DUF2125 domain-containing protein [Xinfangfangia sp. D13-10-4-6]|uniref:DUF2125 domain-containing protein n=1 Tax=Pseudogemmobacter hezensis TaxID=2737662 RepID=UPI0015526F72|nr:DUF2125 domain-containing protein [Pseudogemmobacter hezensis]NPD17086.1 DUF2125 domain-containing protein [Pseudogemmobacter hezensis]